MYIATALKPASTTPKCNVVPLLIGVRASSLPTVKCFSDVGESLYQIPDNIYIADITEVPYTGLKEGVEPVRDTPFSVKLDKSGKVVTRKGSIAAGAKAGKVELFREMSDFRRAGEIEGLSIDPVNDDLVVLNNRGTQIILGMSQGPFTEEGYKGEIHELYIYEKIK